MLGHGKRFAGEPQTARVEKLSHERIAAQKQKIASRIDCIRIGLEQLCAFRRVERAEADCLALHPLETGRKQEVLAVGQEPWPALRRLTGAELASVGHRATRSRNLAQNSACGRGEYNQAL